MKQIYIIFFLIGFLTDSVFGQLISGSVSFDNYNKPAVGVSIFVKGTNFGTVTDITGDYALKIDSTHKILCFSYFGFEQVEIEIKNDTIVNVKMKEEPKVFDDFIITTTIKPQKAQVFGLINSQKINPTEKTESSNKTKTLSIEKTWIDTTLYSNWTKAIYDNINYPDSALEYEIQGNVYAKFKIDNNGEMADLEIIKGVDKYLNNEVHEKLQSSPKWTENDITRFAPINGKYYTGIFILPVKFRIKIDEE